MGFRSAKRGADWLAATVACLAVSACGLDASGRAGAETDASSGTGADVLTPDTDAHGGGESGGDVGVKETEPQDDGGAADTSMAAEASYDAETNADAPSITDVASEPPPPPPTCHGCGPMQCCANGACTDIGNTSCGDPGQACADCTASPLGNQCTMIKGHMTCGCAGPGNQSQCPQLDACHNNQCGTSCDGQHPCNGGCCSGNDLNSSTCVASCPGGMTCQGNYCQ